MKQSNLKIWNAIAWAGLVLSLAQANAATIGTAFPYQGRLTAGGAPAEGAFDLKLTLFDATVGGNPVGITVTNENVSVANGLFTTMVDFGAGIFTGDTYWLEVAVRPGASGANFGAPLLPRQPIIGTPYALHALNAEQLNGLSSGDFWSLQGNLGSQLGTDFVGTIDPEPLEFRVGNERALLLEPSLSVPNVIGGSVNNSAISGAVGVAIGGGDDNDAGGNYGTIGGGQGNAVSNTGPYGTVPGGLDGAAISFGQHAYASGSFGAIGDAQTSTYVMRGTTSTANPTVELFLDGAGQRIRIPRDSAWTFDVLVVGYGANNSAAGFQTKGVLKRVGATSSLVGTSTPIFATAIAQDGGSWSVSVDANDTTDALTITVVGDTFQEVRWVATVRTVELIF